jgi:hypothetical protein
VCVVVVVVDVPEPVFAGVLDSLVDQGVRGVGVVLAPRDVDERISYTQDGMQRVGASEAWGLAWYWVSVAEEEDLASSGDPGGAVRP